MNILLKLVQQWRNLGGTLGGIAPPAKKKLRFIFALLHFKFCPAIKKCYYVTILLKTFLRAA